LTGLKGWSAGGALAWALVAAAPAQAEALRFCDAQADLTVAQKDALFRFGAIVKDTLEASGQRVALVARSGLDLSRFHVRYSHSGFSLKDNPNAPWSVRQLYYACNEGKPRIFDQGMSGFLLGTDDPTTGYLSVVFLPPDAAASLERAALDKQQALALLAPRYSANAYPFSVKFQNCNQWVAEMLATAWAPLVPALVPPPVANPQGSSPRAEAQAWLRAEGYTPTLFNAGALMGATLFVPWLHASDHPADDTARDRYRVSMPASIEAFVQAHVPGATRIEFCHAGPRVVVHHGWSPIADGCQPAAEDKVVMLEPGSATP
jgi:hypothetical protein